MNRKAIVKISFVSAITFLALLLIISVINISSSKAMEFNKYYLLNDKVKLDLNSNVERIKIQTPSSSSMIRNEGSSIVIRLTELGEYRITFYGGENKEYVFDVVSEIPSSTSENLPTEAETIQNDTVVSQNISRNESNEDRIFLNSSEVVSEIRVGQRVKWRKDLYSEKELEKELSNISKFASSLNYSKEELATNGVTELYYETPAPQKVEKELDLLNKEVEIYSDFHYQNVTAFTNVNEITSDKDSIKIYWEEEARYLNFEAYDLNNNSLIDYIEWIVPHLSNQTFQIIIVTEAAHLDSNRNFISDIHPQIKNLDGIYSEKISDGEFVRVRFERLLASVNDITIFPRVVSGNPTIEVYKFNSSEKVSEFPMINSEHLNKVYLFDLVEPTDTFDLKVIGGEIEFDYIVDPTPNVPREGLLAYGEGTISIPRYRVWNGTGWSAENNASDVGASIEWVDVASSPTREEYALVTVNSTDGMSIQLYNETEPDEGCWGNGTACNVALYLGTSTIANQQKADVEYESVSGHAIVVYSDNTNVPKFRTWNGSVWSAQLAINATGVSNIGSLATTGTKETMRLAASPNNGDEIALVISDSNDDSEAIIWNGTGWNCESPVLSTTLGTGQQKKVEIAYEQNSGDLIIVSIVTTTAINITQKSSGACSFTSIRQAVSDSERIDIAEQIGSDRMIIVGSIGGTTDDMNAGIWNGSAYVNASGEDTTIYASEASPNRLFSAAWAGRKNGIVAYSDSAGTAVDWFFYNQTSTAWNIATTDFTPTPGFGGAESNIKSFSFLDENKSFVFIKEDSSADLWAKIYDGDSNSWSDTEGGATLEGSSSSTDFPSFDFGWLKYIDPLRVNIISPIAGNYSNSTVYFNVSLNNGAIFCNYSLNGGTNNLSMQRVDGRNFNATNLSVNDGNYLVRFYCFDAYGNSNITSSVNFTIDDTAPNINFTNPTETNNTYLTRRYILVNVSANDSTMGVRNITIYLYNSSLALINSTINSTSNTAYYNFSVNSDGLYFFNASATDRVNNTNRTELRGITIDTSNPQVSVISPVNNQNYSSLPINFNITTNENSTALFTLNGGINNYSMTKNSSGTGFNFTNTSMADGNYLVRFYVNDSAGNRNYTVTSNFSIDSTFPLISYGNGMAANGANLSRNWIYVNVSVTEANEANITFVLYNLTSQVNVSTFNDGRRTINWTGLAEGSYTYNVSIMDRFNNYNFTQTYSINLDNSAPSINFTNPTETNNTYLTRRYILVNVSANDLFLSNITLYIYNASNSLINSTTNSTSNTAYYNFSVNSDGVYFFNVTATDYINNRNGTERRQVIIDTSNPQVSVISPVNNQNYSALPIHFNITTNENATVLFTFNNGVNNYTMIANSSRTGFNFTNTSMADGNYLVRFYVNDSAGNRNYTSTSNFTLDSTSPSIVINSPINNTEYNYSSILFDFNINDFSSISSIVYHFNSTNYTYTSPVSRVLTDGNYTLHVYANDTLNNLNHYAINFSVNKLPNLTISYSNGTGAIGSTVVTNSYSNGLYDLAVELTDLNNEVYIYGFNKSGNQTLIYSNYTNEIFGTDRFAISFEGMIFSHANITLNASGDHLYKCTEWNMTSLTCINPDGWDVVSYNPIGSLFNLTLSSADPGFLQLTLPDSETLDDGYALQNTSAIEYGARNLMIIANSSGANSHALIAFNISRIPLGVIIDSANLTIRCSAETLEGGEAIGIGAHLVYSNYSWTEGTGGNTGAACTGSEFCYNTRPSAAQYNTTPDYTLSVPDGCTGVNYTFDMTDSITSAYSQSYRNVSLYLVPTGSNTGTVTGDEIRFATKEAATANQRPRLNITYHSIPRVNATLPLNGTIYNYSQTVEIRINASDPVVNISSAIVNITIPNGTIQTFVMSNISFQIYQYNYTIPSVLGRYNITFRVNNTDNYLNGTSTNWFIVVDSIAPAINFTNPTETNNTYLARRNIVVNVTASDLFLANITIYLYNSSMSIINFSNSSISPLYSNFSVNIDGTYYFRSISNDSTNDANTTELRQVYVDTSVPNATVTSPIDYQNYSSPPIHFNITTNENATVLFTFNNGVINYTLTANSSRTGFNFTNTSMADGNYLVRFYVNDSAGNRNYTSTVNFTLDTTNPQITYGNGVSSNNANVSRDWIYVNVSVTEINEANITFLLYNSTGQVNISTFTDRRRTINWTGLADGSYSYNVSVVDYVSRSNTTQTFVINLDFTYPSVNFTYPTDANASEFERDFIYLHVSVDENNFANMTFVLYNASELVNISFYSSVVNEINWTNLSSENMTYFYNVTVMDISDNYNRTETRQIKLVDITVPYLVLSEPINKTYYSNTSLPLTFSADDLHLSECWYNIDNDVNISLPGCTGTVFDVLEGSHLLNIYANDSLGLVSNSSVYFVGNESLLPKVGGILVYSEGAASPAPLRYRVWDGTSFSGELNATNAGALGEWITVRNAPSRDEQIIVTANSLDDVNVRINSTLPGQSNCWHNGTTCGYYLNLTQTSTAINRQKATLAYETYKGDAVIVYSQNNATLAYRTWNGTTWSATLGLPQTLIASGVISYVSMVSHPFNDEIALIFSNTSAMSSIIWNGTTWSCEPTTLLSTTMSAGVWQHADLDYEQVSGDLLIVNTHSTQTEINYTVKENGVCSFSTFGTSTINMAEQGEIIVTGARYGSDHIMIMQEDTSGAANSEDMESIIWNGTNMINLSGNDITTYTATSPNIPLAPTWAGTSNFGIAIYSDAVTSPNIDYFRYNISNVIWQGAATGIDASGATNFSIEEQNIKAYSFIERNRSMLIFKDDNDNLWAKFYDGDTNTFGNLDSGTAFDTTVSSTTIPAFDFEFNYDRAGPDIYPLAPFGYINTSSVLLNISAGENALSCVYSLDSAPNISMSSINPKNFVESLNLSDDDYNIMYTCEDKWENKRAASIDFIVDTTLPQIFFNNGTAANASELQQNFIFVNVTLDEINFANITYELRNSTSLVNRTFYNTSITNITWNNLPGGFYYFNVSTFDLARNYNRTETRTFNLTRVKPVINLLYPTNGSNFTGYTISQFNFSVSGNATIVNCSLMGTWSTGWHVNQTIFNPTQNQELNFSTVNVVNNGFYHWNVFCTDNLNVRGYNMPNFTFSAFNPAMEPILLNMSQTINDGRGNVTLFWNQSANAYLYRIYANTNLSSAMVLLNTTNNTNYTDTSFAGNIRKFYIISAWNPISENYSSRQFGAHVYTLSRTATNSKNWISFPTNASYLVNANDSLLNIRNATAFTMWNSTGQRRVTCNSFSCPSFPSCTDTNCNFGLVPGMGYEVNINLSAPTSVNWSLVGIVYPQTNITLDKNTTSFGKNWVGILANTTFINAQNLYGNVTLSDAVSRWNANLQTSQGLVRNPLPFGPAFIGNNFNITIETGYEVSVNASSNYIQR